MTAPPRAAGRYGSILAVPTVSRWWESRTAPERLDLYTRWSFYAWLGTTPLFGLLTVAPLASGTAEAVVVVYLAGATTLAGLGIAVVRAALSRPRGEPATPRALLGGLLCAALATAAAGLLAARGTDAPEAAVWAVGLPGAMGLTACSPLWSSRVLTASAAGVGLLVGLATALAGRSVPAAVTQAVVMTIAVGALAVGFRFSVWVLGVVVEMERTRGVQLQLAVAEERLRFSRDLHDVMGRNLSAIAVKSQLAGELVRRQRPEAADEVADISRIAEQSLREVREVVRGYRTADLASELAGARSVLRAAGVDCTVAGEERGPDLPAEVQTAFGWVVREAVTNVLRHSRARECSIVLTVDGGTAGLAVGNDGVGSAGVAWGSGLTGLAERLGTVGGTLTTAADGGRFLLTARLPLREAA